MEPTAADICEALDRLARSPDSTFALESGWSLYEGVRDLDPAQPVSINTVARLVGELVTDGRLAFRSPLGGGARTPPPGVAWTSIDLQNHVGYYLTEGGRRDAETTRRLRRERGISDALAGSLIEGELEALGADGAGAVRHHAAELDTALLDGRWSAAVGAAKDLVESAAHAVLTARGEPAAPNTRFQTLVRTAFAPDDEPRSGWTLARGVTNVTQALAELRNREGSGHGRADVPEVTAIEAQFAATTAVALARLIVRRHAEVAVVP